MKSKIIFTAITICTFFITSCSHRLVGTWNVQRYERSTPGQEGMNVNNIGTITFKRNGEGIKNLDYSLLGVSKRDVKPFEWSVTDSYITISGDDSDLSKTWIFIENKNKFQKWQATDGANKVQTLELKKD